MFEAQVVRDTVARGDLFQLFDNKEALKLDIYPRELIAGELDRSEMVEVFEGVQLPIVSRVDAAVSKLVWISNGSQKSRRDLRQICRTADEPDCEQIRQLAKQLDLESLLDEVLSESEIDEQ